MNVATDSAPAIEALLRNYCAALDARSDPAGVAATYWTGDGVLDNTAIGSPAVEGRVALAEAFTRMFATMELLDHRLSGFRLLSGDDDRATAQAAVAAAGRPAGGETFAMSGRYRLEARRANGGWKLARLTFTPAA